jgi:hypothetical protein
LRRALCAFLKLTLSRTTSRWKAATASFSF